MSKQRQQPLVSASAEQQAAAKRARLAAELRANLARRKAQARERTDRENDGESADEDGAP